MLAWPWCLRDGADSHNMHTNTNTYGRYSPKHTLSCLAIPLRCLMKLKHSTHNVFPKNLIPSQSFSIMFSVGLYKQHGLRWGNGNVATGLTEQANHAVYDFEHRLASSVPVLESWGNMLSHSSLPFSVSHVLLPYSVQIGPVQLHLYSSSTSALSGANKSTYLAWAKGQKEAEGVSRLTLNLIARVDLPKKTINYSFVWLTQHKDNLSPSILSFYSLWNRKR